MTREREQEVLCSEIKFGNGRSMLTYSIQFTSEAEKQAYLKSTTWQTKQVGYGARILQETPNYITFTMSNTAD